MTSRILRYAPDKNRALTKTVFVVPEMARLQLEESEQPAQLEQVGGESVDRQVSGWEPAGRTHTHLTALMFGK